MINLPQFGPIPQPRPTMGLGGMQAPAPGGGGLGGFLQNAMSGLSQFRQNNPGALSIIGGIASGEISPAQAAQYRMGVQEQQQEAQQRNQTLEWLRKNAPEIAGMVDGGLPVGDAWKHYIESRKGNEYDVRARVAQQYGLQPDSDPYREFVLSGDYGSGANGGAEFGLTPQYGVDAQGNPVLIQLSKSGTAQQTALPEGVSLSREPIKLDAGTHFVLLDPITRQPVGQIPKNNYDASFQSAQGSEEGKAAGERNVSAPADIASAQATIRQVDELLMHPGLEAIIGPLDQYRGTMTLGGPGNDALARLNQLQGGAFLAAFQTLKGGGTITEVEGMKAEQAIARLSRAQDKETFQRALRDFRDAVDQGLRKLQAATGAPAAPAPAPSGNTRLRFNPATGELE